MVSKVLGIQFAIIFTRSTPPSFIIISIGKGYRPLQVGSLTYLTLEAPTATTETILEPV